jgi:hypothetical protein
MMAVKETQLSEEEKKEIREQMRKTEKKICPGGNPQYEEHEWEEEPRLPKGSTKDTIDKLKKSEYPSEQFEGHAAQKNVDDGDLTIPERDRESKVSRNTTLEESEKGEDGDQHKVFRHCKRKGCKVKREIDHTTDNPQGQAEAKDVGERFDSYEQMRQNASIQKQTGASMTYKINGKSKAVDKIKAQIEYAARFVGMRVRVKVI